MRIMKLINILLVLMGLSTLWAHQPSVSAEEEIATGERGGRLFQNQDISLELLLFERGMPPHFRAYVYEAGKLIVPKDLNLTLELTRFNDKKEQIEFVPINDFLQSQSIIHEPHSFDVNLHLKVNGKTISWQYSNYEGRVTIGANMLQSAGIQVSTAHSQILRTQLKVVGKITPNRDTLTPIYARYSGIVKLMTKNLGNEVSKGELLSTIESNESLQNYNVTAPMNGTIVQKYVTNGELAQNTKPLYEVANLNDVWADFTLYRKEAPLVKQGMQVLVTGDEGKPRSLSQISYIAPLGIEDSQTTLVRAVIPNTERIWIPGMYVNGAIVTQEKRVPVAVKISAIQKMAGKEVLFVQKGDNFEASPVVLGAQDDKWVEILSGLDAGQRYVSKNSFFIKAEIGKEGASHED